MLPNIEDQAASVATTRRRRALSQQVERLLTVGIGMTARAIDETSSAADLSLIQWRVLVIASQGELRIGELAASLGTSIPSTSRLVRRVEARRLLTATRANDDRRATIVALSPAGREVVDAVIRRRRELIERALDNPPGDLPGDPSDLVAHIADRLGEFA